MQGWGIETSLDVEYAHAIAPAADIVDDIAIGLGTTDVTGLVGDLVRAEHSRADHEPPVHAHGGSRRHEMEP